MQLKRARKARQDGVETRERLFGDLGAPLARLHEKAVDEKSWRAAVREWAEKVRDHICGTVFNGLEG